MTNDQADKPQLGRFKDTACEPRRDDDPDRFKERSGKLAKHEPVEVPE